jgi:hypothetical protein
MKNVHSKTNLLEQHQKGITNMEPPPHTLKPDRKNEPEDDVMLPFHEDAVVTAEAMIREDEHIVDVVEDPNQQQLPHGWVELWSDDNIPYYVYEPDGTTQ